MSPLSDFQHTRKIRPLLWLLFRNLRACATKETHGPVVYWICSRTFGDHAVCCLVLSARIPDHVVLRHSCHWGSPDSGAVGTGSFIECETRGFTWTSAIGKLLVHGTHLVSVCSRDISWVHLVGFPSASANICQSKSFETKTWNWLCSCLAWEFWGSQGKYLYLM